jgi:hypothetical protein
MGGQHMFEQTFLLDAPHHSLTRERPSRSRAARASPAS